MQGKLQFLLIFFLGMVTLSQAVIDLYEPEAELIVTEGENVDLMCRTSASKFSYCTFTHPNNVLWVKFKFDDASQTVKEQERKWLNNFEYSGNSKECKMTLKNVEAGKEGHSGKWKCKVEDWETKDQEEATGKEDEKVLNIEVTSVMKIKEFKTIQKGDSINFKCLGNKAFGKCKIQIGNENCTFDATGVNSKDPLCSRLTLNDNLPQRCLITVTDVTEADSGVWSCELDNVRETMNVKVNPEANPDLVGNGTSSTVMGPYNFAQSKFTLFILIVAMFLLTP